MKANARSRRFNLQERDSGKQEQVSAPQPPRNWGGFDCHFDRRQRAGNNPSIRWGPNRGSFFVRQSQSPAEDYMIR